VKTNSLLVDVMPASRLFVFARFANLATTSGSACPQRRAATAARASGIVEIDRHD
jgi:hypothetical protein